MTRMRNRRRTMSPISVSRGGKSLERYRAEVLRFIRYELRIAREFHPWAIRGLGT